MEFLDGDVVFFHLYFLSFFSSDLVTLTRSVVSSSSEEDVGVLLAGRRKAAYLAALVGRSTHGPLALLLLGFSSL